jgi:CRISPR/Cas system-associated protein Cas7 (RAMP superfamily)
MQLEEELTSLMGENEQMLQQKMAHDGDNMWEQRYQELLGKYLMNYSASNHCKSKWRRCKPVAEAESTVVFPCNNTNIFPISSTNFTINMEK